MIGGPEALEEVKEFLKKEREKFQHSCSLLNCSGWTELRSNEKKQEAPGTKSLTEVQEGLRMLSEDLRQWTKKSSRKTWLVGEERRQIGRAPGPHQGRSYTRTGRPYPWTSPQHLWTASIAR